MENFMLIENELSMEKIIKKDGYVYLVQDWDKKGFETYTNMGKDIDDPRWKGNNDENSKQKKGRIKKEED